MALTITAEQRDALYDRIIDRLSGISDVWLIRIFARLRETSESERTAQAPSWAESRHLEERNRLVSEACVEVLQELGVGRAPSVSAHDPRPDIG